MAKGLLLAVHKESPPEFATTHVIHISSFSVAGVVNDVTRRILCDDDGAIEVCV